MRKFILLISLIISLNKIQSLGQIVNEVVNFDNYVSASDNDFENRFINGGGLFQVQSNGITGGCLETPQTSNWGNDNAIYCSKFNGVIGVTYTTSISFRYDTTQLNSINFDRPVSLWMSPHSDPNHYIIGSLLGSGNIQIVSYSATASSGVIQRQQGHWYNIILTTDFTGGAFNDKININARVNDLGITGNDPPIPNGFTNTILYDSVLIADTSIDVSFTGTSWGGAQYLDNFQFAGMKSYENCISTNVAESILRNTFSFSISNISLTIKAGKVPPNTSICIYNTQGQKLISSELKTGISSFDISTLKSGIYLVLIFGEGIMHTEKFILMK